MDASSKDLEGEIEKSENMAKKSSNMKKNTDDSMMCIWTTHIHSKPYLSFDQTGELH